jgi:hypothetical protein
MPRRGQLKRSFEQVRRDFFPLWDRKKQWRVRAATFLAPLGRCEADRKTIFIRAIPDSEDELKRFLIHEICHHNASGHAAKWQRNMETAAQRAKAVGEEKTAEWISEEIGRYQEAEKLEGNWGVYEQLGDWIVDTEGEVPYRRLVVSLAREFGQTVKELEKAHKRLRRVYDAGVKAIKESKEAQERFRMTGNL